MAKTRNTKSNTLLSGTSGNDTILNGGYWDGDWHDAGSNVTINSGAGNDDVYNLGLSVTINTGAGNDEVTNYSGDSVTITGGKGNDSIYNNWNFSSNAPYGDSDGSNVLFKYSSGDGNDIIYGFKDNSTLSIGGGAYSTKKSGSDVIVTVGKGKISLIGAASLDKVNIKGTKSSTKTNFWKLSGTTATYGTSSKTLVTVSGVKSTDGLSISGKVVTVAANALNKTKVTISSGYSLALADDVAKTSTKKAWSLSGTTASYNQTTTAGYKLANNVITYTKKAIKTLATVTGVKSIKGFKLDGKTIKLATSSLSKKVSVSGGYAFEFASDYKSAKITGSSSNDTIKTSGANMTITGGKGNDSLTGGSGADTFVYSNGDGNDVITNFDENDKISLKSGAAEISTSGNDIIFTVGTGKITLKNANGKNINYIDASGNENIYPNKSTDIEYNADGTGATLTAKYSKSSFEPSGIYKDILVTINAAAVTNELTITGNQKANRIVGSAEDDTIKGGNAKDTILGGDGNDKIYGEKGNDSLLGGAGDDSLWGGAGTDILTGGAGDDIFFYKDGDGNDTITDFNDSMDKIIVSASNIGFPEVANGDVTFAVGTGKIVIKGGANKFIQLYGENGGTLGQKYSPQS